MMYLGDYAEDATLYFMWSTNDAGGASITRATNGTVSVYKAGNTTQVTTGVTDTEDYDSLTGIHHCTIVLTDAFYATANDYMVVLSAATIDGEVVNAVLAHFSIQNRYYGSAGDPWNTSVPGAYAAGKAGYILGNRISADVTAISGDTVAADNLEKMTDGTGLTLTNVIVPQVTLVDYSASSNLTEIGGGSAAALSMEAMYLAATYGAAAAGTLTTTTMTTNLTEVTDDHYNGLVLRFTDGALVGQATIVTDYDGATKMLTFAPALTEVPTATISSFVLGW